VLIVDTLLFVTGGFFEHPAYHAILLSGVIGKSAAALVYAAALATYLARFDLPEREAAENRLGLGGLFQVLTYRQRYEALRTQVTRDALTGAHSRRFFDEVMQTQLAAAKRSGAALVVMMVDVDHYTRINDSHGHAEGDRALRVIAQAMSGAVRSSDVVCRYGGEEFCIVMPGTSLEAAATLASRLREEVPAACTHAAIGRGRERITVTIGLAAYPQDGDNLEAILRAADRRLYIGKSQGRDQAVAAG
jgi:diguanylate cyclase (GGDEF)-like protein